MSPTTQRSLDATWRSYLEAGELAYQQCSGNHAVFPPRPVCPTCGDRSLTWTVSTGSGSIYSATTITPRDRDPYTVVLLDIDEGFRMMSRLDGPDATAAAIGDRVRINIRPVSDGGEPAPFADLSHEPHPNEKGVTV